MATLSGQYKLAKDNGLLHASVTEEGFATFLKDPAKRKEYYDYVQKNNPGFYSEWEKFNKNVDDMLAGTAQPSTLAVAQEAPQAVPTMPVGAADNTDAAITMLMQQKDKDQKAAKEERARINAAQLPMSDDDRTREEQIRNIDTRLSNVGVARFTAQQPIGDEREDVLQQQKQLEQERATLQGQRKNYMAEPTTVEEARESWIDAWSENTEEGKQAKSDMEKAVLEAQNYLLEEFKKSDTFKSIYADVQGKVNRGELSVDAANKELNTRLEEAFVAENEELLNAEKNTQVQAYVQRALKADNGWLKRQEERLGEQALREALDENLDELNAAMKADYDAFAKSVGNGVGAAQAKSNYIGQQQLGVLGAAAQLLRETNTILSATKKGEEKVGSLSGEILRHIGDKLKSIVTFGMSDISSAMYQADVFKKIADANAYDNPESVLDRNELVLYDAIVANMAAQIVRAENTSHLANAGKLTAEMIPFIMEIAIGKGLFSGMTKAAQRGVSRSILRSLGNGKWRRVIASKTGELLSGAIESAAIAAIAPSTYKQIFQNEAKIDPTSLQLKDGKWTVGEIEQQSTGSAIWNAYRGNWREIFTETGGLTRFAAGFLKVSPLGKLIQKTPIGKLSQIMDNNFVGKMFKQTAYHGIASELSEEWENTFYEATEAFLKADKGKKWEAFGNVYGEFVKPETQVPMLISFSLPAIFGGAVTTGQMLAINSQYKKAYNNLRDTYMKYGATEEEFEDDLNKLVAAQLNVPIEQYPDVIRAMATTLSGGNQEQADEFAAALSAYMVADANLGAIQEKHAKKQRQVQSMIHELEAAEQRIAQDTHTDGRMYHVEVGGMTGYVVSGPLALNQYDGEEFARATNSDIVTVRMQDGSVKQVAANQIKLLEQPQTAENAIEFERRRLTAKMNNLDRFKVGDVIYITDNGQPADGSSSRVVDVTDEGIVTEMVLPDGTVDTTTIPHDVAESGLSTSDELVEEGAESAVIEMPGGTLVTMQKTATGDWMQVAPKTDNVSLISQREFDEMLADSGAKVVGGTIMEQPSTDDVASGNGVVSEEAGEIEQPTADKPYATDEQGNPLWADMNTEQATQALLSEVEGDKELAKQFAQAQVASAKVAVNKANKRKPQATNDLAAFKAEAQAIKQEQAAAQAELSKWENIVLAIANYKTEAEQAEADAAQEIAEDIQPEQRKSAELGEKTQTDTKKAQEDEQKSVSAEQNSASTEQKSVEQNEKTQEVGEISETVDELDAKLAAAEAETDTNPTEAQKKAENYKQGHVTLWGLPFTIENPKGSVRRGTDANGKQWEQVMNNTYGKIRRTEGVDGDHIDVFFGPNLHSEKVFVVDQRNVNTGEFDEHKVMLGFDSMQEAQDAYLSNYEEGWQGMGPVTETTMDEFKKWIESSHRKTKAFSEYKSVKQESVSIEQPKQVSVEGLFNDLNTRGRARLSDNVIGEEPKWVTKYKQIKEQYPDAMILFRVGDFYEVYMEDANDASNILGITLTKRGEYPMAGFPFHALDTYLPKIVRAGKRVAIADNIMDEQKVVEVVEKQENLAQNLQESNNNSNFAENLENDEQYKENLQGGVGQTNAEPSETLGESRGGSEENARKANDEGGDGRVRSLASTTLNSIGDKQAQEEYLKESDLWRAPDTISNITERELSKGKESEVHFSKDGYSVIKLVDYSVYSQSPADFLRNRIELFNELFPETAYTIVGVTERDGKLNFVLSQPFIKGKPLEYAWWGKGIEEYNSYKPRLDEMMMSDFGMENYGLDAYQNEKIRVQDLHYKNIIVDEKGNWRVIDAITSYRDDVPGKQETPTDEETTTIITDAIGEIKKSTDTRDGSDIWLVNPTDRVSNEEFKELKKRAKAHNGYYSSFKQNRGFLFRTEEDAIAFNRINENELTTDEVLANTGLVIDEAETTRAEAETIATEQATQRAESSVEVLEQVEQQINKVVEKIDNSLEKVNDQMMLLGYYESEGDANEWGLSKKAEKAALKDVNRIANQLARDLGVEGKIKASANIAPAGGDISFRIPLLDGKELYVDIPIAINGYVQYYNPNGNYDDLYIPQTSSAFDSIINHILYRIETPSGRGADRYGTNHFAFTTTTYNQFLENVRYIAKGYAPIEQQNLHGYKIGDKVLYKGKEATIYDFNDGDLRPVLDAGLAPVLYEVVDWEDISPITAEKATTAVAPELQTPLEKAKARNAKKQTTVAPTIGMGDLFADTIDAVQAIVEEQPTNKTQVYDETSRRVGSSEPTTGNVRNSDGRESIEGRSENPVQEDTRGADGGRTTEVLRDERSESRSGLPLHAIEQEVPQGEKKNTRNNHVERGVDYAPKTPKERFEANFAAIKLLKELEESGKQATKAQMKVLRKFSGWGGLGSYFPEGWIAPDSDAGKLKQLLTPEEYDAANMSRNSAYFTPGKIIDKLWDIAAQFGFKGGNILEGSAGIGEILARVPQSMNERSDIMAVEIDPITGGILKQLYPDAQVEIDGFQNVSIPNGSQDLVITNVPFVRDLRVIDKEDMKLSKRFGGQIQDFCIAKNITKLREGGLGIFIAGKSTLDNSKDLRRWIVNEANCDVVGAFRLNKETFGGTGATADIIVVKKRVNGAVSPNAINVLDTEIVRIEEVETEQKYNQKKRVFESVTERVGLSYNQYYVEHPESMGGEMYLGFEQGDTRFGGTSAACYPQRGINQDKRLDEWVAQLGKDEAPMETAPVTDNLKEYENTTATQGSIILNSKGEICIANRGKAEPLAVNANKVKGQSKEQVVKDYKALKDAISNVLSIQEQGQDEAALAAAQKKLNAAYDSFVKKYGYLNKNTALSFLRNDVDFPSVAAIEKYEETETPKGKQVKVSKTDIFSKRVIGAKTEPKPTTTRDAVVLSVQQFGRLDTAKMAEWLGTNEESVRENVVRERLGFIDPETQQLQIRHEYLSGNVRQKLAYAQEHNEDGKYDSNIEELEKVIPMTIPSHLIEFSLGSTWIDPQIYADFVKEKYDVNLKYAHVAGVWSVSGRPWNRSEKNRAAGVRSEMLDMQVFGDELFLSAMNNVPYIVSKQETYYDGLDKKTRTITDKSASQACATRIDEIRDEFTEWARQHMQKNEELGQRMEQVYNERFNAIVPMEIDEQFTTPYLPGMNPNALPLYPIQQKAIVRGTMQPVLLAHEVGTGKTRSLISTAMEMRRLGTAKKPMIVVQNATVMQFVNEAKELFPNAKVLTCNEKDRTSEGRREFYAKIKYNDWDMIVVPQSVFDMIPDSEERMRDFVQEKIDEKLHAIEQARSADLDNRQIQAMERELGKLREDLLDANVSGKKQTKKDEKKEQVRRENAKTRAEEMLIRQTDDVADFDKMGIDALLVDEAHNYKHLGFATMMQRGVKGIDPSYSKRAAALYLKVQAVFEKSGGKNVVFATGTPISNTAAEIWTFMKYLLPKEVMKENEIYYFDDFVRNFGKISQSLEFATNGKFKENTRFASYVNIPELARIWGQITDTRLSDEVKTNTGRTLKEEKIPTIEGGKQTDIFLEQSESLVDIMNAVRSRLEEYENMSGAEKKENSHIPLTMYGIAKRAAIDPRLVDSTAADEPESKTNKAVEETLRALKESKKYNGTVAIFCDNYRRLDTVNGKRVEGFNIFEEIRNKLIAKGVPADQIVIMKSGMTDKAKQQVFDDMNAGTKRVILGSTQTLGTGVNIQTRLFTLIHMDAPDRPMDMTQREGRILRQGNMHKAMNIPVRILRFGVKDSLDVTGYQRLQTKSRFIDSIMRSKDTLKNNQEGRVIEEDEEGLYDNPVAVLSGSQYAMLKSQAEREYRKLLSKQQQHNADQVYIENQVRTNHLQNQRDANFAEESKKRLAEIEKHFPNGKKPKTIVFNGVKTTSAEALDKAIKEYNKQLYEQVERLKKGNYYGDERKEIRIPVSFDGVNFELFVELKRKSNFVGGQRQNSVDKALYYSSTELNIDKTPASNTVALAKLIEEITDKELTGAYDRERIAAAERRIAKRNSDNAEMEKRRGKQFGQTEELNAAKKRVDEYTELMRKELAEKEEKYANRGTGKAVGMDAVIDAEVENDDTEMRVVSSYNDADAVLTESEQLTFDALQEVAADAGLDIVEVSEEDAQKVFKNNEEPIRTPDGKILGYAQGDTIYLTKAGVTPETMVHEYTHIWAKAMQRKNRAGWENIKQIFRESPLWNDVVNDPNYQGLKTDDAICSEVLARYSGKYGAERLDEVAREMILEEQQSGSNLGAARVRALINRARTAIKSFWKWVGKNLFGITKFDSQEDVADRVLYDLLNATDLDAQNNEGAAEKSMERPSPEFVEAMRAWNAANPYPVFGEDGINDIAEFRRRLNAWNEARDAYRRHLYEKATEEIETADPIVEPLTTEKPIRRKDETAKEYAQRLKLWQDSMIDRKLQEEYTAEMNRLASTANQAKRAFIDAAQPIEEWQNWLIQRGAEINGDSNAYKDMFLAQGRVTDASDDLRRNIIQPLESKIGEIIDSKKLDSLELRWSNMDVPGTGRKIDGERLTPREIIGVYCQAKDCAEAEEKGLPNRGKEGFINNLGVSYDTIVSEVESRLSAAEVAELWDLIRKATKYALEYDYKSGRISEDTYNEFQDREYYVPQRGWRERDESGLIEEYEPVGKRGHDPYNAALVKARGRKTLAADPFAYIMSIDHSSIVSSENNKIKQKMLQFCLDNERLGLETGAFRVKKFWLMHEIDPDTGKIRKDEDGAPIVNISYTEPSAKEKKKDNQTKEQIKRIQKDIAKNKRQIAAGVGPKLETALKTMIARWEKQIADLEDTLLIAWGATNTHISQRTRDEKMQHEVQVMKDGQRYVIELQDEKVANAINKRFKEHQQALFSVSDKIRNATRFMSAMLTQYNPEFALSNFVRDYQVALVTLLAENPELVPAFVANFALCQRAVWVYAFNDRVRDRKKFVDSEMGRYLQEYMASGAPTGFSYMQDLKSLRQEFDKMINEGKMKRGVRAAAGMFAMLTEWSETAVRFSAYVSARKAGWSVNDAAYMSKELTTNFDRAGEMADSGWMAWFSFFRATMNGNIKFFRAIKKFPIAYSIIAAAYFAAGIANQFMNPNDPDDEVLASDFTRETNFVIGKWRIPVAHFMRIFYGAGVNLASWMQGTKNFGHAVYNSSIGATREIFPNYTDVLGNFTEWSDEMGRVVPKEPKKVIRDVAPTFISPWVDVWTNRNFMGGTINREPFVKTQANTKDILMAKDNTLPIYKAITEGLYTAVGGDLNSKYKSDDNALTGLFDISGSSVQHIAEGYLTGGMDMLATTANMIYDAVQGNELTPDKLAFIRKFYNPYTDKRAYDQQYWLLKGIVQEYERTLRDHEENNPDKYELDLHSKQYQAYEDTHELIWEQIEEPTKEDVKRLMEANKQWAQARK